ncbi:hypothetical protein [Alicyclobacillus mengziensis]|uniref:Uncharacterized protein n=1 Tax=Alicyclobacillus mengziensis TaxID=2931921 RepID=A0A9X7W1G8_9BACL|nr:hypothetical protein [Alicyclobacillus mengziensis]QSO48462.1 hypothetical protein JZ786_05590 [Alicyclobacillus mengziensis]
MVYAVALRAHYGGWRGCGWGVSPIKDKPDPVYWSMMAYTYEVVVMGMVTDPSISKVRLYLAKPRVPTSELPVNKNGFFLSIIDTKEPYPRPKGVLVEGLDYANNVVYSPSYAKLFKSRWGS